MRILVTLSIVLVLVEPGRAQHLFIDGTPGTGPPPATLGGYTMMPYPLDDTSALYDDVYGIPAPFVCWEPICPGHPCGEIAWDIPMSHRRIGAGWATWSHGYTGDVYYSNGATAATMWFPDQVSDKFTVTAFYMYVEPEPFSWQAFTVVGTDVLGESVTSGPFEVHGSSGATYVGIYSDYVKIESISVSCSADFAWGEFGVHCCCSCVPEAASLTVLASGGLVLFRRRR